MKYGRMERWHKKWKSPKQDLITILPPKVATPFTIDKIKLTNLA